MLLLQTAHRNRPRFSASLLSFDVLAFRLQHLREPIELKSIATLFPRHSLLRWLLVLVYQTSTPTAGVSGFQFPPFQVLRRESILNVENLLRKTILKDFPAISPIFFNKAMPIPEFTGFDSSSWFFLAQAWLPEANSLALSTRTSVEPRNWPGVYFDCAFKRKCRLISCRTLMFTGYSPIATCSAVFRIKPSKHRDLLGFLGVFASHSISEKLFQTRPPTEAEEKWKQIVDAIQLKTLSTDYQWRWRKFRNYWLRQVVVVAFPVIWPRQCWIKRFRRFDNLRPG